MSATSKNPNVVDACCEPGRLDALRTLGERLDAYVVVHASIFNAIVVGFIVQVSKEFE
jgi:hypothetical protein